jgi:flagellar assembly protein FliH
MTRFQPYQFQDLSKAPPPSSVKTEATDTFVEQEFAKKKPAISEAQEQMATELRFQLDDQVAGHIGLAEKERIRAEEQIRREIEQRWERTAEKAEVSGYTKGLDEGKLEAIKAEEPRIREKLERLDSLLQQMDKWREKIFLANEAFMVDLVSRVAGMVALKEIKSDPDYIRRLVLHLLNQLGHPEDTKIYVGPSDSANIEELRAVVEKEFGRLQNLSIESSPEIQSGGCVIETRFGVVDGRVNTQIENAMRALKA